MLLDVWLFHFNLKLIFDLVMKKYQLIQLHRWTEQDITSDCGFDRHLWQSQPKIAYS